MKRYVGIIYFKNGPSQKTGSTDSRQSAERMARDMYDRATRMAVSDWFKPTRYEVVEI